jgi:hypothetical protein
VTDTAADADFFDRIAADDEGGGDALLGAHAPAPPVDVQEQQQHAPPPLQQQYSPGARPPGRLSFASAAEDTDGGSGGGAAFFENISAAAGAVGEHAPPAVSCLGQHAQHAQPSAWQQAEHAPGVDAGSVHGAAAAAAFGGGDGGDAFFEQLGEQPGADAAAQQFEAMHLQSQQQQAAYAQDGAAADATTAWQPDAGTAYGQEQQQQAEAYDDDAAVAAAAQAAASASAAAACDVPLPEGWVAGYSAEGYLYYFNTANGESSWEHPGGGAAAQPQELPAGDDGFGYAGVDAAAAGAGQYEGQYESQTGDAHAAWQHEQQAAQEAAYAAAYGQPSGYEQQPGAAQQAQQQQAQQQQQQQQLYEQQQQLYQQQQHEQLYQQPHDAYGQQHAGAYGAYDQQQAAYAPVDAHTSGMMGAHAAQPGAPPTFFVPSAAAQQPALYMPGGAAPTPFMPHGQPAAQQYMQQGGAAAPWGAATAASAVAAAAPRTAEEALRSPHGRGPCPTIAFGCGGMLVTVLPGAPSYGGLSGTSGPVVARTLASVLRADGPGSAGESYVSAMETCVGPIGGSGGGGGVGGVMAGMGLTRGTSMGDLVRVAEERGARAAAEAGSTGAAASQQLLWGYLRLMCAHRGSLAEEGSTGSGAAELAELLVPAAEASSRFPTLQVAPPDAASTAMAAAETERLLLAGRRADAVAAAIAGRLWGPALLLARGLGERAMFDAAAACIRGTVAAGTPLHTSLCMAAGVTSDVGAPSEHGHGAAAFLSSWRQNLAALAFCRAAGDGAAMVALGDRLWSECGDAGGAHLCYLLAGVPPLPYSPGARVCLVGSDHRCAPRTYVTPAAVQRSELLEAALRAANPQTVLPALQPYKLVHAAALAELGHVREALAYVDNAARAIRASGATGAMEVNAPVFAAIAAALEERLRANTSAKGVSIASGAASKLLGGLSSLFDKGISTIFGEDGHPTTAADGKRAGAGGAAAAPAHAGAGGAPAGMHGPGGAAAFQRAHGAAAGHRRTDSDASVQSVELDGSGGGGNASGAPGTRPSSRAGAVSPSVDDSDARSVGSSAAGGAAMVRSLSSFFSGTFRSKKGEAKLGDSNKFYYDEKLKMWLEEGAKPPPPPEPAAPPPTMIPPVAGPPPPGGNSFSARTLGGGVRSRYVDTFNAGAAGSGSSPAGGGPGSPAAPPAPLPPAVADVLGLPPRPKLHTQQFFVPGAVPGGAPDASAALPPPPLDAYTGQQQQLAPQPMQQYGGQPYSSSYDDSGAPATLAAQVDAPPPPIVGYGEMLAEAPQQQYAQPPPQYEHGVAAWSGQQAQPLAPPPSGQQGGGSDTQQWGELEL